MLRFDEKMGSQGMKSKDKQKGKEIQSGALEKVQLTTQSAASRQSHQALGVSVVETDRLHSDCFPASVKVCLLLF